MSDNQPISDNDIRNMIQMLNLVHGQIRSQRIEEKFALRQLDKAQTMLAELSDERQQRQSVKRFERLYDVVRMLGSSLKIQEVLDHVMDAVIELTGAERGFLLMRDDDGDLEVTAARNLDQQTLSSEDFQYSRTITNYVLDEGESITTTNALEDPRFNTKQSVLNQALRSIMATPLRARGRVIGVAYVENRIVAGIFGDDDLNTLETLAGQASIAIDNALLFSETDEELSRRVDELQLLRRIDKQLNATLERDTAMLTTLAAACRIADAKTGYVGVIEGEPPTIVTTHKWEADNTTANASVSLADVYPRVWEAVDAKAPLLIDTGQYGLHTVLLLPIMRENDVLGVMALKREDGGVFTDEQQDLIQRVVTRAAVSIENARLYAAVQAANDAKSDFVSTVAHDLKVPMTNIQGYADLLLLKPEKLDDAQLRYVKHVRSTVERMERLVNDLADINHVEAGQFFMEERRVRVGKVIEAVRDTVQPQIVEREHTFIVDVGDELPEMLTDYYRLVQVLTNLLSNAYKYTPDGGTITLSVHRSADRIAFRVEDTGIGLSAEQIDKLGTKFWRAEDEFTRSQPGSGLGFAITQHLVRLMGSEMHIESEVGVGSAFSFSIEIADAQEDSTQEAGRVRAT